MEDNKDEEKREQKRKWRLFLLWMLPMAMAWLFNSADVTYLVSTDVNWILDSFGYGNVARLFSMSWWSWPLLFIIAGPSALFWLRYASRQAYERALLRGEVAEKPSAYRSFVLSIPVSIAITIAVLMLDYGVRFGNNRYHSAPPPEAVDTVKCVVVNRVFGARKDGSMEGHIILQEDAPDSTKFKLMWGKGIGNDDYTLAGIYVGGIVMARVVTGRKGLKYIDGDSLLSGLYRRPLPPAAPMPTISPGSGAARLSPRVERDVWKALHDGAHATIGGLDIALPGDTARMVATLLDAAAEGLDVELHVNERYSEVAVMRVGKDSLSRSRGYKEPRFSRMQAMDRYFGVPTMIDGRPVPALKDTVNDALEAGRRVCVVYMTADGDWCTFYRFRRVGSLKQD